MSRALQRSWRFPETAPTFPFCTGRSHPLRPLHQQPHKQGPTSYSSSPELAGSSSQLRPSPPHSGWPSHRKQGKHCAWPESLMPSILKASSCLQCQAGCNPCSSVSQAV